MKAADFIKHPFLALPFLASFLLLFIALLVFYIGSANFEDVFIIHFDPHRGIDFLGDTAAVYRMLALSWLVFLINLTLSKIISKREPFFSYLFGITTVIFSILIFIAVWAIISVN